jgi:hypothetical protein
MNDSTALFPSQFIHSLSCRSGKPLTCSTLMSVLFFITNNKRKKSRKLFPGGQGEVAQTMYTHVSKYKNDKIKGENKINK